MVTYEPGTLLRLEAEAIDILLLYTCLLQPAPGDEAQVSGPVREISAAQTEALVRWVRRGGGLLALHAATVIPPSNQALRRLVGGTFLSHPPRSSFRIYPMARAHPLLEGIEAFQVDDEFYVQTFDDVDIHMVACESDRCHPMMWSREDEAGRVVHVAPGHDAKTWTLPAYQRLLLNALSWLRH